MPWVPSSSLITTGAPPTRSIAGKHVLAVADERGLGHADVVARQDLDGAELVTRVRDAVRRVRGEHVHLLELSDDGRTEVGDRCADARHDGVVVRQRLAAELQVRLVTGQVDGEAQGVEHLALVAAIESSELETLGAVRAGCSGQDGEFHGDPFTDRDGRDVVAVAGRGLVRAVAAVAATDRLVGSATSIGHARIDEEAFRSASRPMSMRKPISSRRVRVTSAVTVRPARRIEVCTIGRCSTSPDELRMSRVATTAVWATTASAVERCHGWISKRTHGLPSRSNHSSPNACNDEVRAPVSILALR